MDDRFVCFAYGSNMLTRRLQMRTPSAYTQDTGFVPAYRLAFDKVSRERSGRRSGKGNMQDTGVPKDCVYGVLFSILKTEKPALDEAEGLGQGYELRSVSVMTGGGEVPAVAYIATDRDDSLRPYDWYQAFVVAGAMEHRLPDEYIASIRAFETQRDPDTTRASRRAPERLIRAVNRPSRDLAKLLAFSWVDTKEVRPAESRFYAFLNDENRVPSTTIVDAVRNYDIVPVVWSTRDAVRRELAG